jgi:hypothetical protein
LREDPKLKARVRVSMLVPHAISLENAESHPKRWGMKNPGMHEGLSICCSASAVTYLKEARNHEG